MPKFVQIWGAGGHEFKKKSWLESQSHNTSGRAGGLKSPGTAQSGWKNFHVRIVLPREG